MSQSYEHVPAYPLVFLVFYGALAIFALGVRRHYVVLRQMAPVGLFGNSLLRAGGVVAFGMGQARVFREPLVGLMHMSIFLAFAAFAITTADAVLGGIPQGLLSALWNGCLWQAILLVQNAAGLCGLIAVGYALWRRLVRKPSRLMFTSEGLLLLVLIAAIIASGLLAGASEAARYGDRPGAFVESFLARGLRSIPVGPLTAAFALSWWAHVLLVALFLCYLPSSKHFHILAAFLNIYLRKLTPSGQIAALDLLSANAALGVREFRDLRWKDLLDGLSCTECGRCQESCPVTRGQGELNPRSLVLGIRRMATEAERSGHGSGARNSAEPHQWREPQAEQPLERTVVGNAITFEGVWECLTCGACAEACPVMVEPAEKVIELRRGLVLEEAAFPTELRSVFWALDRTLSPFGLVSSRRLDWTSGLSFEVPTVAGMSATGALSGCEVLYWVGCATAFDERAQRVARAVATCLHAAGVSFAILGEQESCCGDPARRLGREDAFQAIGRTNIRVLLEYGMDRRRIVASCPHCYNTIANEYGQLGASFDVWHHAAFLDQLVRSGRLAIPDRTDSSPGAPIAFHDSCYAARHNGVIDEPRRLLRSAVGASVAEPTARGRATFCCGAGGGQIWTKNLAGRTVSAMRARQLVETGSDVIATECPFCMTALEDGLIAVGAGSVKVLDVSEVVAGALKEPGQSAGASSCIDSDPQVAVGHEQ
jgi:Fe-S oxidoreductase/nitrate reductase gamma subunit